MNRNVPSPTALAIVRQIFAQEARARKPSGASNNRAVQISEKLRRPLTTLAGASGSRALLSRVLTLPLDLSVDETSRYDFEHVGAERIPELPFSTPDISFLADDIIRLRYVEIDGQLRKILMVVKMRGGNHSKDIRQYEISSDGIVLRQRLQGYEQVIMGPPIAKQRD